MGPGAYASCEIRLPWKLRQSGEIQGLGGFDGDGVMDVVLLKICAYCTSFLSLFLGAIVPEAHKLTTDEPG